MKQKEEELKSKDKELKVKLKMKNDKIEVKLSDAKKVEDELNAQMEQITKKEEYILSVVEQFEKMREDSLTEILKKEEGLKQKESELKDAAIRLKEKAQNLNETAISNLKKTKSMETSPKLIAINRKHYESITQKQNEEEDKLEETANFKNFMDNQAKMNADSIADKDRVRRSISKKYNRDNSKSRSRSPTTSPDKTFMKGTATSSNRNEAIKKKVDEDNKIKSIKQKEKDITPVLDGKEFITIQEFVSDSTFIDLKLA